MDFTAVKSFYSLIFSGSTHRFMEIDAVAACNVDFILALSLPNDCYFLLATIKNSVATYCS
jgi:hypothetical protein